MDIKTIEAAIIDELKILIKPYSPLRRFQHKWRYFKQHVPIPPPNPIEFNYKYKGAVFAVIYKGHHKLIEGYPLPNLAQKVHVKRSPQVFKAMHNLWSTLNPNQYKAIHKRAYLQLNEGIGFEVLNFTKDQATSHRYATIDSEVDFPRSNLMVFTEFYNSIFELVDNFTKTALPQEYSVFIDMIDEWVKETEWLQEYINNSPDLNLNSTKKTQYHHWMSQLLSDNSIEVQQSAIAQHSTRDLKVVDYLPINKSRRGKHNRSGRRRSFRHSDARLSVEPKPTPKNSRKQVHSDTIKPSPKSSSKADLFRRSPVHAKAGGIVLGSNSARHLAVRRNIL